MQLGRHLNFFIELVRAAKKIAVIEDKATLAKMLVYKAEEQESKVE